MTAANGMARLQGYPLQQAWLFSGHHAILARILDWMQAGEPGAFVVTGSAGTGKSAVVGRIVALTHPAQ